MSVQNNYSSIYRQFMPVSQYTMSGNPVEPAAQPLIANIQQAVSNIPLPTLQQYSIPQSIYPGVQKYMNTISSYIYPQNAVPNTTNVQTASRNEDKKVWKNDLRDLFQRNNAVIYALVVRTFNAKDKNGNGLIDDGEEIGTFINAIERLDGLKDMGINTLHVLPIHPPGKNGAMGTAGSVYAPLDYLAIDPKLDDSNNPADVKEEAKLFVQECHKRGIRVMIDLPSCASIDMYQREPNLMAKYDLPNGKSIPKIPQGWQDIRMFEPWKDRDKKVLNQDLLEMHKKFVDMCFEIGADGIRADVARAKPPEFWDKLIGYARSKDPNFAFLAESYTYEDASPMANIPADRPEELLKVGFDSYYGQDHIFHQLKNAKEVHDNMILNLEMSRRLPPNKSVIGSFATHDDKSPMTHGGVPYCNLTTALQATLPMTNPYFVTGFESGDRYIYSYKDKRSSYSDTDNDTCTVHPEMLDIFNYSRKPGGNHAEIGDYMSKMFKLRQQYDDVITKGSYIPLKVAGNNEDQVIAYVRHYNGKTLLIIANKDVNARQKGKVIVPGLKGNQPLIDITPSYGVLSNYKTDNGTVNVDLGPARFHMFEIDDKDIEKKADKVYRQNQCLDACDILKNFNQFTKKVTGITNPMVRN